jgi:hypothetical protein
MQAEAIKIGKCIWRNSGGIANIHEEHLEVYAHYGMNRR